MMKKHNWPKPVYIIVKSIILALRLPLYSNKATTTMWKSLAYLSLLKLANAALCTSPDNIYTVQVDLYAGEFGT
jgi:hypothetical protein